MDASNSKDKGDISITLTEEQKKNNNRAGH